ncbi:chaperone modulator CbpM [Mucilaginibacter celer]|uniref:MerR family transcriptional regulator n=1 Tax=Mucilaginibacter celer TaxID=2305508 RepID=A0A494VNX9_9SPHI|nr:chaperone modulator CbpM [Mucilaginibacter celer]AYL95939.1 MerR family transcriptional regulator [Mucilaginibacter celer]
MKTAELITINDFCVYHNVEYTFIISLHEAGLVEIIVVNEIESIPQTELQKLEKLVNLHQLDINIAGIEAISHLLARVEKLHEELRYLNNRLSLYE